MFIEYIKNIRGPFIALLFIIINIIIKKVKKKNDDWAYMNLGNSVIAELIRSFPTLCTILSFLYFLVNFIIRKIIFDIPGIILSIVYIILYIVKHYILEL